MIEGTRTIGHAMQAAGYLTGATGKWHMSSTVETGEFTYQSAVEHELPYLVEDREVAAAGFDEVFGLFPLNVHTLIFPHPPSEIQKQYCGRLLSLFSFMMMSVLALAVKKEKPNPVNQ